MIRELERRTTIKSCSTDEGGCGRRGPMQQSLEGRQPRAFALQLVWESLQEAGQDIRDTLELIQEVAAQPLPKQTCSLMPCSPYFDCVHHAQQRLYPSFLWRACKPLASCLRIAKVPVQHSLIDRICTNNHHAVI